MSANAQMISHQQEQEQNHHQQNHQQTNKSKLKNNFDLKSENLLSANPQMNSHQQ